jgi:UDP-N-acetylglucosamine diphosphorylase/glucosamine-1-phosphate N-acetyltransferase
MPRLQAIILAAGESSRFWPLNYQHKSLIKIMGRPLIWYAIEGLRRANIRDIIIVQGKEKELEKELEKYNLSGIKYVIQEKPTGTGDAILKAEKMIRGQFFVLNAERIDITNYVTPILEKFKKINLTSPKKNKLILLAVKTKTPWLFGILKLKKDKITNLIEKPKPGKEPSNLRIVGVYFLPREFFSYLKRVPSRSYSFEDALLLYAKERDIRAVTIDEEVFSLKFPWELFKVNKIILDRFLKRDISKKAHIAKGAKMEGKVFVADNVRIFENVVIKGPCYIGKNSIVGNNSLVREYTNFEDNTLVGANIEVTRSIFQEDVHAHSGFFGDSIFGKNCRIGAGTVTANIRLDRGEIQSVVRGKNIRTGLKSLGSIVGRNSIAGIHCSFMPGILIGSNSFIGPHSLVKKNIEDNTIFYSQFKEIKKKKK